MCGVAGLLDAGCAADPRARGALVEAMAAALGHRGPDGAGTWVDDVAPIALGHRRLAVVGLGEGGRQPMGSRSGRWQVTYNGEIYNAAVLGRRLEASGTTFRGTSDTEVLVEALDAWGLEDTLAAVNGMFAFGAWDRRDHQLVLARDRIGEKPLAYGLIGGRFAFASELRSLRTLPGATAELDPDAVALFLRFKYVPAPWTIHRGISKLVAGHHLTVTVDHVANRQIPEPVPYWSLAEVAEAAASERLPDDAETLDRLDDAISRAVRARLRSDVPIGAFLSGGIDSGTVATHAAAHVQGPLQTFTIASDDPDHDESAAAREMASRLGALHTEQVVTSSEALAAVPTIASVYDEPFADSSQLPTALVSSLARGKVTVALSGDGGDELFGGYNRHVWLPQVWSKVARVPRSPRRAIAAALAAPAPASWDRVGRLVPERRRPRLIGLKAEKLASVIGLADAPAAYGRLVSHWDEPETVVVGASEPRTLTHRPGAWPALPTLTEQMMVVDGLTYLPDDVLVKVDRASMAVGLEARVPLLDPEVIELAFRLPPSLRVRDGVGKWALRELLARRHPRELIDRPKAGFGVPISSWLRGPLRPWAEDLLAESALRRDDLLDPAPIRHAWKEHLAGKRDASYDLWDVLMLQSWRGAA